MLDPRRIFLIHVTLIGIFVLANIPIVIMDELGYTRLLGYSRLMRLEEEGNVPTLFSALGLAACSVVAAAIRRTAGMDRRDRSIWTALSILFVWLAADEILKLHEMLNKTGSALGADGAFFYIGVFVYVPLVAGLAIWLLPFWLRQEGRARLLLAASGTLYVAAAIGLEIFENILRSQGASRRDILLHSLYIVEEAGEMLAVALFLFTFLSCFRRLGGGLLIPLRVAGEVST